MPGERKACTMANVIIVLILVLICIYGVRSYMKKLAHGCCGAGGDEEKKIKVKDKNPANYPHCVTIEVEGMTCGHCKLRVENALNSQEGVWAKVDLEKKTAMVRMKQLLPEDELRRIVSHAGYFMTGICEKQ